MRILLLTQWFNPEPAFKGLSFAKELVKLGHEVEVLTGFPNYPGGKIYSGYKFRLYQREEMDGVRVNRVALYPSHDGRALHRILNYVTFAVSTLLLGPWLVRKPDVVYCYHPPASAGLLPVFFQAIRGVPFIYDIQDLWPDTLAATQMVKYPWMVKVVNSWCNLIYRKATRIVVLSNGFKAKLIERGVPLTKLFVIENWTDESEMKIEDPSQALAQKIGFSGRFNVVFAGTMGKAQGLGSVLEAAKILQDRKSNAKITFIGGGIEKEKLRARAEALSLSNVQFLERVPVSEIARYLVLADVLLVHLKKDPLFEITIPSKIQAYLSVGKPLLIAVPGDAEKLVLQASAGVRCDSESPNDLAEAVLKLEGLPEAELQRMGSNGSRYYHSELSLAVGVRRFEKLFKNTRVRSPFHSFSRRVIDVGVALFVLVISAPFQILFALLIWTRLGSPILFSQVRPGLHGVPFNIYKFRTMTNKKDLLGNLLSDEERLTPLGQWMRRWSLDEIPQFWNVLRGDLSLVGPRPLLMRYLPRYTSEQARRMDVKPGITGWAQVNGRNAISWQKKFELDVWYVDHESIMLDFRILGMTLLKTLRREGISNVKHATMPEFFGNKEGL